MQKAEVFCCISALNTLKWTHLKQSQLMSDNIETQVKEIIAEQLSVDIEKVTSDAKFIEDLGADSLDTVELVMAFEDKFSIEVPDEKAETLKSVADVVAYIKENQA